MSNVSVISAGHKYDLNAESLKSSFTYGSRESTLV